MEFKDFRDRLYDGRADIIAVEQLHAVKAAKAGFMTDEEIESVIADVRNGG